VIASFAMWLGATSISRAVTYYSWIWPTCETLHFAGLALLIGNVGVLDLRLLGAVKRLPVAPLNGLIRWGVLGFVINLLTGVVFFVGAPSQYITNIAFGFKLLFMALAAVNLAVFYRSGLARAVARLGPGDDASTGAKIVAATSLFLWVGVIFWGRMLPFIGDAF
jgi:hypothetical protein